MIDKRYLFLIFLPNYFFSAFLRVFYSFFFVFLSFLLVLLELRFDNVFAAACLVLSCLVTFGAIGERRLEWSQFPGNARLGVSVHWPNKTDDRQAALLNLSGVQNFNTKFRVFPLPLSPPLPRSSPHLVFWWWAKIYGGAKVKIAKRFREKKHREREKKKEMTPNAKQVKMKKKEEKKQKQLKKTALRCAALLRVNFLATLAAIATVFVAVSLAYVSVSFVSVSVSVSVSAICIRYR